MDESRAYDQIRPMLKLILSKPLTVLPVSVFLLVAGQEGWASEGTSAVNGLLWFVGLIGIVMSIAVLSKRSP